MGTILDVRTEGTNRHFTLQAEMASELKVTKAWHMTGFASP